MSELVLRLGLHVLRGDLALHGAPGLAAGLEFELFQPQGEVPKDFYAELPIKIRVVGDYHEFGEFVSGLASLPRIVTIHDVKIEPRRTGNDLTMEATARTYRYLDEGGS